MRSTTDKPLSFDQTKMLVLQIESVRNQVKEAKGQTTAMAANLEVNPTPTKCFNCDDFGHIGRKCPHTGTGLRVCFEYKQVTKHIAAQCPQRLAKESRKNSQLVL